MHLKNKVIPHRPFVSVMDITTAEEKFGSASSVLSSSSTCSFFASNKRKLIKLFLMFFSLFPRP